MSFLRECWGLRILVRCILSQSKTSMVTPYWCSWRTWTPVPTWMGFAGRSFANSSSNASPSRPLKNPLPWICFSSHSMWVLQEQTGSDWKLVQFRKIGYFCFCFGDRLLPQQLGMVGGFVSSGCGFYQTHSLHFLLPADLARWNSVV